MKKTFLGTIGIGGLLIAALLAFAPSTASAQGGFYLGVGIGPAVHMDDWPTQVRLEQEIGYYFDGRPRGFFIAFAPSQSFANEMWILTFAPRFGYMFNVYENRDLTFQLGPAGTIPGIAVAGCFEDRCRTDALFHFSFSFLMRLLLANDRLAIYVRPVEFEFAFGDYDAFRYVLEGGVQFHL